MGNFTGETVVGRTGSSIPAAIARDTLDFLERQRIAADRDFPAPVNWVLQRVCAVSGMLPSEACFSVINEYVQRDDNIEVCTWHKIVNGKSETIFPAEYQAWFNAYERQGSVDYASRPLEIITPRSGFVYLTSQSAGINEIPVEVIGGNNDQLRVTHNGKLLYINRPFVFYIPCEPGVNTLRVQNGDEEDEVLFAVE